MKGEVGNDTVGRRAGVDERQDALHEVAQLHALPVKVAAAVTVSVSPSASVAVGLYVYKLPSVAVVGAVEVITGAALLRATVMVILSVSVPPA